VTNAEALGHGIHLIPLPLPLEGLPFVNAYVVGTPDSATVIDVGVGSGEGFEALGAGLDGLDFPLSSLRTVICTHLHPDHMGLASRLVEETGCDYVMHQRAAELLDAYNDWGWYREMVRDAALANGGPPAEVDLLTADEPRPEWAPASMEPNVLVSDGDKIALGPDRHLDVVHTPGHEPSHICLVDSESGAMFSGDHVLPRITPFVPYLGADTDNLGTYLESLRRVEDIKPRVTYPAHGAVIPNGADRAHQILLHHERRLTGMSDLAAQGATAWEVMTESFRPNLAPMHLRLAFQETMAHLEHLRARGELERDPELGIYREPA
jgi:glyoxylase-like metal-dependent hydrolase (beta-lactamase superfamily II)